MTALLSFVAALAVWLWAMPYLLGLGAAALLVWWVTRTQKRAAAAADAARTRRTERERGLEARMWDQHRAHMRGDDRGTYGAATPAMREFRNLTL